MPLNDLQKSVLQLLANNRSPESMVGGATPLGRYGPRYSLDIDFFHDRDDAVALAAQKDAEVLQGAGFTVTWLRKDPGIWIAVVRKEGGETRLEWVHDSDYRFFPPIHDPAFGYVLHPVDIATNKALAAASRREPRDLVDLIEIHEHILPLGAVVWAAVAKDPGWSPESLIGQIRRNGRYRDEDIAPLLLVPPVAAAELSQRTRSMLDEAEAFVVQMPSEMAGLVFLEGDRIVQPDPTQLDRYGTHSGSRGGHWPGSSDIQSAMLAAWKKRR